MCPRRRLPAQERKKEIRKAAGSIFLEKGFIHTTMEDVIARSGMSKGGVYRHYKSTSEMLYDLMEDGNQHRRELMERFIEENGGISIEELIIQISMEKILDENPYKSLYAMFLIESEKDRRLGQLKKELIEKGKKDLLLFAEAHGLSQLRCLLRDEWIALINSLIVAVETIGVRSVFLENREMLRAIIRQYIRGSSSDEAAEKFEGKQEGDSAVSEKEAEEIRPDDKE